MGRLYWLDSYPATTPLIEFGQGESPYDGMSISIDSTGELFTDLYIGQNYQAGASATKLPLGQWVCLDLDVVRSTDSTGTVQAYMNDTLIAGSLINGITSATPEINTVTWGVYYNAGDASLPAQVWMDEVEVATRHISCAE